MSVFLIYFRWWIYGEKARSLVQNLAWCLACLWYHSTLHLMLHTTYWSVKCKLMLLAYYKVLKSWVQLLLSVSVVVLQYFVVKLDFPKEIGNITHTTITRHQGGFVHPFKKMCLYTDNSPMLIHSFWMSNFHFATHCYLHHIEWQKY